MRNYHVAAIAACAMLAVPAMAQTAGEGRTIASINGPGWIFFGDNQEREKVADATIPGKAALRITVPRDGGPVNGATGQSGIKSEIKKGATVRITAWLKGVSTVAGGPAKAIVKMKDSGAPYGTYAEKTFELTTSWKPYSIEYVATRDFASGSTNMLVQFALGRQTVDVGPATAAIVKEAQ